MRCRWLPVLLGVAIACGCGSDAGEKAAPSRSVSSSKSPVLSNELVAWMGKFCAAANTGPYPATPTGDPESLTAKDRKKLIQYLEITILLSKRTRRQLDQLPPAPVPAGTMLVDSFRKDLDTLTRPMPERLTLATEAPTGSVTLRSVFTVNAVEGTQFKGFARYLSGHGDLEAAYRNAPACGGTR